MQALEIVVFLFYAIWMVFSILAQGEASVNKKIKQRDLFNLIPDYQFFCPHPTTEDYHLYYRHQNPDATWTAWTEPSIGKRNLWYCFIWNPGKRSRKVFQKTVKVIRAKKHRKKKGYGPVYRILLNYATHAPSQGSYVAIQFKISSRQNLAPESEATIVYSSPIHPIVP